MGLFRKRSKGVGQKPEPVGALGSNPTPDARLGVPMELAEAAYLPFLDTPMSNPCREMTVDGFLREESTAGGGDIRFRCLTEVRFIYEKNNWPAAVFYIEYPEYKGLVPVIRAVRDRRFNGQTVVWFAVDPHKPFVVPSGTKMCVDSGANLTGKTLYELGM